MVVTDHDIAAFEKQGAIVLRGVLSPEEIQVLDAGIEENLQKPGPLAAVASDADEEGEFLEDFCNWQRFSQYQQIIFDSKLPEIAARLCRSKSVRLYHDHLLVKTPNTKQTTPFHQDQPYYNISGNQNVSFWIPVDSVPVESSLQFVNGSHASRQWYLPCTFKTKEAKWFPEGSLPNVPEIKVTKGTTLLTWPLEPGDIVAFHMLTIHGSQGTADRRRAFSIRYIGDDIRHAPRSWRTSPEFPGLKDRLSKGSAMDDPLFPVVFDTP